MQITVLYKCQLAKFTFQYHGHCEAQDDTSRMQNLEEAILQIRNVEI